MAIICILPACTKAPVKNDSQIPSNTSIAGKWIWVKSEGGFSYHVDNPSNTGNQLQVEFKTDGTVDYYKNNELQYSGFYSFGTTIDLATGNQLQTITQNYFGMYPEPEEQVLSTSPGTITFTEPGADRYIYIYTHGEKN